MPKRRVSFFCITEPCWPTFLYLSFNHSLEQSRKNRRPISTMSFSFMCLLVANLLSYCWRTSLERSLSSESIYQWQFITAFSMTMWRSRFRIFLHLASHFWGWEDINPLQQHSGWVFNTLTMLMDSGQFLSIIPFISSQCRVHWPHWKLPSRPEKFIEFPGTW